VGIGFYRICRVQSVDVDTMSVQRVQSDTTISVSQVLIRFSETFAVILGIIHGEHIYHRDQSRLGWFFLAVFLSFILYAQYKLEQFVQDCEGGTRSPVHRASEPYLVHILYRFFKQSLYFLERYVMYLLGFYLRQVHTFTSDGDLHLYKFIDPFLLGFCIIGIALLVDLVLQPSCPSSPKSVDAGKG
jgi:hypothetical protein